MILVENKFGHGALPHTIDVRDHKYHRIAGLGMAPLPFLWSDGFDIENKLGYSILYENQDVTDTCGGQGGKRLNEVPASIKKGSFVRLSAHDLYDHIYYYPSGGTTIRDIGKWLVQVGIREESAVPSYLPNGTTTEQFMRDKTLSDAATSPLFKEFGFAFPKTDIETIACAIRDNNGCVLQITGNNNGTWLSAFPQATRVSEPWSHFVYAGKLKLINGKRFVGILNSWGNIGENGWQWLSEDFFTGLVTNALVIYDTTLYEYQPTLLQQSPTWLQKFLSFFANFFTAPMS